MLKKKDLNKIRRVKWRRLGGGGGKGFRAQIFEQMRDCS